MSYIHPSSDLASCTIGEGTRVWQFVVILEGATIGRDCNICAHTLIEGNVVIGDRVTVKSGVFVWDGIIIKDDVFVGPGVTFTNDLFPRSLMHQEEVPQTIINRGASIGANATILAGVEIGDSAMVGAGSVVVRDVPKNAVVAGNPARILRFLDQ